MTKLHTVLLSFVLGGCSTTITGRVVSTDAKVPLAAGKVNVQRLDSQDKKRFALVTDVKPDGTFETAGDLPEGEYLVEPLIPGFTSESKTVKTSDGHDLLLKANPILAPQRTAIGTSSEATQARGEGGAVLTPPEM